MAQYNKDRTPIPISNNHYEAVRAVKKLSKVPMRYIVENAIEVFSGAKASRYL